MITFSGHAIERLMERFDLDENRAISLASDVCDAIRDGSAVPAARTTVNGKTRTHMLCDVGNHRVRAIVTDHGVVVTVFGSDYTPVRGRRDGARRGASYNNHQCRHGESRRRRNAKRRR